MMAAHLKWQCRTLEVTWKDKIQDHEIGQTRMEILQVFLRTRLQWLRCRIKIPRQHDFHNNTEENAECCRIAHWQMACTVLRWCHVTGEIADNQSLWTSCVAQCASACRKVGLWLVVIRDAPTVGIGRLLWRYRLSFNQIDNSDNNTCPRKRLFTE